MTISSRHGGVQKKSGVPYVMCAFIAVCLMIAILGWTILFQTFPVGLGVSKLSEASRAALDSVNVSLQANRNTRKSYDSMTATEAAIRERAKAAIVGAFVADAATTPLHWIYNPTQIRALTKERRPAFFSPSQSPFYTLPLGELSPYGDEALPLLRSVVKHGGVDGPKLSQDLADAFASYGPPRHVNSASKKLVESIREGGVFPDASPRDDQAHSLVKMPIVVARYAGRPELKEKVLEASRSHQSGQAAEHAAWAFARVLEQVVLGKTIRTAVDAALADSTLPMHRELHAAAQKASIGTSGITEIVQSFGSSCHLPGSFQGPIVAALLSSSYASAVENNILAAGDQASRAHCVGALWAAQDGSDAIPGEWLAQTMQLAEINDLIDKLLAQRS